MNNIACRNNTDTRASSETHGIIDLDGTTDRTGKQFL